MVSLNNISRVNDMIAGATPAVLAEDLQPDTDKTKNGQNSLGIDPAQRAAMQDYYNYTKSMSKFWLFDKKAATNNLLFKGVPLVAMIGGLEGMSALADAVGLENPTLRFISVIKGTNLAMVPVQTFIEEAMRWKGTEKPFSSLTNAWGKSMKQAALKEFVPSGVGALGKAWSLASWLPRTMFHMGEGVLFSNVVDIAIGEEVETLFGEYGKSARDKMSLTMFFARDIGDFLSGSSFSASAGRMVGNMSRFLAWTPVRCVVPPLAALTGAGFALDGMKQIIDPIEYGGYKSSYLSNVAVQAYEKHESIMDEFIDIVMGKGFGYHLCSGSGLGAPVDVLEGLWVDLGLVEKEGTCKELRAEVISEHEKEVHIAIKSFKNFFKQILLGVASGQKAGMSLQEYWSEKFNTGWFNHTGIDDVLSTDGGYLTKNDLVELQQMLSFAIPEVYELRALVTEDFLDADFKKEIPKDVVIIAKKNSDAFLKWLGLSKPLLEARKELFLTLLVEAAVYQASGNMNSDNKAMMNLGVDEGWVEKKNGYYSIKADETYYAALGNYLRIAVNSGDPQIFDGLQSLAAAKLKLLQSAENDSEVVQYASELKLLYPIVSIADEKVAASMGLVMDALLDVPLASSAKSGLDDMIDELEKTAKQELASYVAKELVLQSTVFPECVAWMDSNAMTRNEKLAAGMQTDECNAENSLFNGIKYYQAGSAEAPSKVSAEPSLMTMSKYFEALAYYSGLGAKTSALVAEKIINMKGAVINPKALIKWAEKDIKKQYNLLTGVDVYDPVEKAAFLMTMKDTVTAKVKSLQGKFAKEWVECLVKGSRKDSETAWQLFEKSLQSPILAQWHQIAKLIAVGQEVLKENGAIDKKGGAINEIPLNVIDEYGNLKNMYAIIIWSKAAVINAAKAKKNMLDAKLDKMDIEVQKNEKLPEDEDFSKEKDDVESASYALDEEIKRLSGK